LFQQYKEKMSNTRVSHDTRKKRSSRIALGKKSDHIVVTRDVAIKTRGPTSSLNGMTSSEPNKVAAPSGKFLSTLVTIDKYSQ
jgi:hypothetical protein